MKKIKLNKKLNLNKQAISKLNNLIMGNVKGGGGHTFEHGCQISGLTYEFMCTVNTASQYGACSYGHSCTMGNTFDYCI